jgi:ubiquinone/menaquinone biosynthesis C-methylase UbiE
MGYRRAGLALIVALVSTGCHNPAAPDGKANGHAPDFETMVARMNDPARESWQRPLEVVAALELRRGERVADIGAGTGYFTAPVARLVGPQTTVYAVDVEPRMIDYLRQRAAREGLRNIELVLAEPRDPRLPPAGVDTILIVNTWHHISDRAEYAKKLSAALAPAGRIVVIDFIPRPQEERGFGPPTEMQLDRAVVDRELAAAGFTPARVHHFLEEQYFVEYKRN